jgi:hypothetical protein
LLNRKSDKAIDKLRGDLQPRRPHALTSDGHCVSVGHNETDAARALFACARRLRGCALYLIYVITMGVAHAQQLPSIEHLAKLRANPLRGLRNITLTEQANLGFPSGGKYQNVLTLQALWPFSLGTDWSLVTYTSLPVISQAGLDHGEPRVDGLGDTVLMTAVTPKETGALIWGVGPALQLPTATRRDLGTDLWAAGPTLALFVEPDPWVLGLVLDNLWSFAGSADEQLNTFGAQYFLTYNLPHGWYFESNATVTADWQADRDDRWTVPAGGGFGRTFTVGRWPLSLSAQAFYNVVRPTSGPDWSFSLALQLIFPS